MDCHQLLELGVKSQELSACSFHDLSHGHLLIFSKIKTAVHKQTI